LLIASLGLHSASAQIRDGGIDPWNLGKGDWIYVMSYATGGLGGNVPSVHDLATLMSYEHSQGMSYLIIKAGEGGGLYPSSSSPQFTSAVVTAGHNAGLKIFGYDRSYGTDLTGEKGIADYVFNLGADGYVIDAEIEWESSHLPNNTTAATNLCGSIRSKWPTKFLAHSPFPIISGHSSFPYKEFGYYCDTVFPQDYWDDIGVTPTYMVTWMDNEWRSWQNGLTGIWRNSIKPLAPAAQGWNTTGAEITQFINALKNDASSVTVGGYRGINYWRADLHTADDWNAIGPNNIGGAYTTGPAISAVGASSISDTGATISWSTDQNSDNVVEYGPTISYGTTVSNYISGVSHSKVLSGLSASTTYHYRVKSKNYSNLQSVSGDFTFLTNPSGVVSDILIDNGYPNVTVNLSWVNGTSSSDKYSTNYLFKSRVSTTGGYVNFVPTILTAGNYEISEWHPAGLNRTTDAPHVIHYNGGSATVYVNQTANGGKFNLLGTWNFAAGTAGYVQINDGFTSGTPGQTATNVMADAIEFVYVPPVVAPAITAQPQSEVVNAGGSASFDVTATGTAPLSYQWRRNGSPLANATDSSYTLNNAQSGHAGTYYVVVTNTGGSVTSSNVLLTVNVPPSITSQPQSQTLKTGANATFTVTAAGTAPLSYQWQLNGTNLSAANATSYTRTNVHVPDSGSYTVLVGNVAGSTNSNPALLTVQPPVPPRFQSIHILPDLRAQLVLTGAVGDTYALDGSSNFNAWLQLMSVQNTNGTLDLIDNSASNARVRFYRTRQ
jgi:hypothetical protein